ncbi:hypothetical protein FQZ97_1117410 [compost metagenome]
MGAGAGLPAIAHRVQRQDEIEGEIGRGDSGFLPEIGSLDGAGGGPDRRPARTGSAQRQRVVGSGAEGTADAGDARGRIDSEGIEPCAAIGADLEAPVVVTGEAHFGAAGPVGLVEQARRID